jgi:hypothetical protein
MRLGEKEAARGLAVSRNLSRTGMLVASGSRLEVGAEVTVSFRVAGHDEERTAIGTIVRAGTNEEDPQGLWPHLIAVEFEAEIDEIEPLLESYPELD